MASEDEVERFKAEARAVASLEHPGIVPVYEVGEHEGRHYFTMKLVPNGSLADQVARTPLPSRTAAEIVLAVARAVHHAHGQKVIHRDLKPANILLDDAGRPHVTDFGLAKRLDSEQARTRTGNVIGTPGYMAPELASGRGKEPTPATDVYGLGAVLYALLTGRPPFQAATLLDTLSQVLHEPPAPPGLLNPNIDSELETVCLKCLEKDPADRYASAEELAEDLDRYLDGEPVRARPTNSWGYLSRRLRKRREVLDTRSWGSISLLGAASTIVTHTAIFWITQPGGPIALFLPVLCGYALLFGLLVWKFLLSRSQPCSQDERDISAMYIPFVLTGLALFALAYPWDRLDILAAYPALALLCGFYHVVIARLYWGPFYLPALAYYLLAVVMKFKPEWAPLEYGILAGAHSLFSGLVMLRYRKGEERGVSSRPKSLR
jgi:serine/threonine-protein kinase